MKRQSTLVLTLKHQIQATLRLIALRFKQYVLRLLDLEAQLEEAMTEQLTTVDQVKLIESWSNVTRVNKQTMDSGKQRYVIQGFEYSETQFEQLENWGWDVDRECQRIKKGV